MKMTNHFYTREGTINIQSNYSILTIEEKWAKCIRHQFENLWKLSLYRHNELWVNKWKACELCLVQVHDKQFVSWCHFGRFTGEFSVEIAYIFPAFLKKNKNTVFS